MGLRLWEGKVVGAGIQIEAPRSEVDPVSWTGPRWN